MCIFAHCDKMNLSFASIGNEGNDGEVDIRPFNSPLTPVSGAKAKLE